MSWPLVELGELMPGRGASVDPTKFSEEEFALFSVPAYDSQVPDRVFGKEIGSSKQVVQPGDVLLSKIVPHIRRAWIVPESDERRQIGSSEWIIFRSSKFFGPYLRHLLLSDQFNVKLMQTVSGVGGSLLRARPAGVAKLKIPLPPLEEQRRIAAILDQAEELRAQRRAAIALLDQLPRAIFLETFGDPTTNPMRWPVRPLHEAVEGRYGVKAGPFGSALKKEDYVSHGYRVYGQEQVIGGSFAIGDYYIDEQKYRKLESCSVQPGDLLMSLVGSFGKVLIVPDDIEPGIINPRLLKISPDPTLLDSVFLAHQIQCQTIQSRLSSVAHGGTMGVLNAGILKELIIILPPVELQRLFVIRIDEVLKSTVAHKTALTKADAIFASLQHRAFGNGGTL